jgi:hypothetical protein
MPKKQNQNYTFIKSTKKKKEKQKEKKEIFGKYNQKSVRLQLQSIENRTNNKNKNK